MTPRSQLEITGNFFAHPFAELLAEIASACLDGSLRISDGEKKCVVYFSEGSIAFAASNERSSRIFEHVLKRGKISREELVQIPNFANDFELADLLVDRHIITSAEKDSLFRDQLLDIVIDLFSRQTGEWTFSPLARIREGLSFDIDLTDHLLNYSRCLETDIVKGRFRSLDETFRRTDRSELGLALTMQEGFILSRIEGAPLKIAEIASLAAMPETEVYKCLYTLWLCGLILREKWNSAFPASFVAAIRAARLERVEVKAPAAVPVKPEPSAVPAESAKPDPEPAVEAPLPKQKEAEPITLDQYLDRVEGAPTFYDILGIDTKAESAEIKHAYLWLAKQFHPDHFHSEGGDKAKRIQQAFTQLSQAYDTLKNADSREIYDYRVRKELIDRETQSKTGESDIAMRQREQATENFDRGLSLLMENDPDAAVTFLARAAHLAPKNARYRAYYGKALAFDDKQRHKAESEMQAALKLDPDNPAFRIMLAEFFIQFNLLKRAEGELNRLLAIFPGNREGLELLKKLKVNA